MACSASPLAAKPNEPAPAPGRMFVVGRVLDPLGNPLDGKGPVATTERRPVELGRLADWHVVELVHPQRRRVGPARAAAEEEARLRESGQSVWTATPMIIPPQLLRDISSARTICVAAGDALLVIESMKLQMTIAAACDGIVGPMPLAVVATSVDAQAVARWLVQGAKQ